MVWEGKLWKKDRPINTLTATVTSFPYSDLAKEPAMLEKWESEDYWATAGFGQAQNRPTFVLHDGPPYANGNIHRLR